ncbi:MAG: VWA domain-containing protein [Saprospiraceae bacterium]
MKKIFQLCLLCCLLTTLAQGQETNSLTALDNRYFLNGSDTEQVFLYLSTVGGKAPEDKQRVPLNISIVIDRSNSMKSAGKLDYVKKAAKLIVNNLSEKDYISIVVYNDEVDVVQASTLVEKKYPLKKLIKGIEPAGVTNISDGMLEGYEQVQAAYDPHRVNRVLLLSDGLANRGITKLADLQQIAKTKYRGEKLAISTFGVGTTFNENLLTSLAEYGRGNYYFIDDAKKIPKIFGAELKGLLSVVAKNAQIRLHFPSEYLSVAKVYGYKYETEKDEVVIDFNDIFAEEEKSVLIAFDVKKPFTDYLDFESTLAFEDVPNDYEKKIVENKIRLKMTANATLHQESYDQEVLRNIILFKSIEFIERATLQVDEELFDEAKQTILDNQAYLDEQFKRVVLDPILEELYQINLNYGKKIARIKGMTKKDRRLLQKTSKSKVYLLQKKRSQ